MRKIIINEKIIRKLKVKFPKKILPWQGKKKIEKIEKIGENKIKVFYTIEGRKYNVDYELYKNEDNKIIIVNHNTYYITNLKES